MCSQQFREIYIGAGLRGSVGVHTVVMSKPLCGLKRKEPSDEQYMLEQQSGNLLRENVLLAGGVSRGAVLKICEAAHLLPVLLAWTFNSRTCVPKRGV